MASVERRKPTRTEWQPITSRQPVVRRISPPTKKPKGKEQPR